MGSRGTFSESYGRTGGIPIESRNYSCIGYLGRIKIIQCDKFSNNPTITYSNTANTVYFSYSKERKQIEHIYYFKNHKLVKSVDMNPGVTPHTHYWNSTVVGRKTHSKHNNHELSDRDARLVKLAQAFNSKH
jgi:hypothetical protein